MLTRPCSSSSGNRENRLRRKITREEKATRNLRQLSERGSSEERDGAQGDSQSKLYEQLPAISITKS